MNYSVLLNQHELNLYQQLFSDRRINFKYASRVNPRDIEFVKKTYKYYYPEGLEDLIEEGNNGSISPNRIKTRNNVIEVKTVLSYNKKDKENVYDAINTLIKSGSQLLPFANTPSGDLIGTDGKSIILWNHETGKEDVISPSLDDFLDSLY